MNRRNLIKTLGLSAVGLATVPLWVDSWNAETLGEENGLAVNKHQKAKLDRLVDIIIPETDTPGAKSLKVDSFLLVMLADCYEKKVQDNFLAGLAELDSHALQKFDQEFLKISEQQQEEIVQNLLAAPGKEGEAPFMHLVKDLTILGYSTSEYVMTNILHYEFVPSRFYGSVPVKGSTIKMS